MGAPTKLQLICQITGTVPIGSGKFQRSVDFVHAPPGATASSLLTIGTGAGQVGDVYNADPQNITNSGTPTTITLSSVNDPNGDACAFQHAVFLLLENFDTTNTITIAPGASNGVAWLPTAGIPLPPGLANQSSILLLAVPSGLAIAAASADTIKVSTSGGTNVKFNLTVLGKNT